MSFYRHYIAAKAGALNASTLALIVNWDPQGASEADLRAREEFLDKIGSQLVAVRHQFDAETKALQPKLNTFNERVAAAEDLHRQAEALPMGSKERAGKEKSLKTLVEMIEADQVDIDQAKADVVETKQWLEERENAHKEAASSLRAAKGQLERAQKDLSRATQQASREKSRTAEARAASGLAVD
ncbi:MAG: hypothetical protein KBD06_05540, partial [Candidatus Pacebacteria bacterium]|nr:hypothetical protein [Candidatus Paceibacterota bacterium]